MIIFTDNVIYVVPEDFESKDSSVPDDLAVEDSTVPADLDSKDTSVPEDFSVEDSSVPEDLAAEDSSVFDESSATGETQQSSNPTIINDIVVPDNFYSKYCFFFLMLLFALFVGRSFRKGV